MQMFMKIQPAAVEMFHVYRQTDGLSDLHSTGLQAHVKRGHRICCKLDSHTQITESILHFILYSTCHSQDVSGTHTI
jgi:hypothetical protein